MAEFHVEQRQPLPVVTATVMVTLANIGERVGPVFDDLERSLHEAGLDDVLPGLLRYHAVERDSEFRVDVAHVVPDGFVAPAPYASEVLPGGLFAVATQSGPYEWITGLTRELMEWGRQQGLDYAMLPSADGEPPGAGETWECWYEAYLEPPSYGEHGPEGPVQIALKLR
ncbi:GyrI-like domain-containing protein [Demequina sediminicola]|uniref:GyrI-like domain-containing protein n=1 Tax=Demequina sediminicola TaxID=1095026 RepID=UPI00078027AC|nr:GyrI-like domain-containing protein [Demequina sediminicola]